MQLARVIGDVVATDQGRRRSSAHKLLVLQPVTPDRAARRAARSSRVDAIGAGVGEHVFFVRGKEASFPFLPAEPPADACVVGIVDHWDVEAVTGPPCRSAASSARSSPPRSTASSRARSCCSCSRSRSTTAARHAAADDRLGRRRRRREGAGRHRGPGRRRSAAAQGRAGRRRDHRHHRSRRHHERPSGDHERRWNCARSFGTPSRGTSAVPRRLALGAAPRPRRSTRVRTPDAPIPSHAIYLTVVNIGDACVIEPAVPCNHCGYCKSHGH